MAQPQHPLPRAYFRSQPSENSGLADDIESPSPILDAKITSSRAKISGLAVVTPNKTSLSTSGYVTPQGENLLESFGVVSPRIGERPNGQVHAARISMAGEASVYYNWVNTSSLIPFIFHTETARRPTVTPSGT